MKVSGTMVGRFSRRPDPHLRGALIYGDDMALIAARRDQLCRTILGDDSPELRLTRLEAAAVRKDPAAVFDALRESAFFGGRRVVLVDGATDGLAEVFTASLDETVAEDAFLLVTAGSLPARSKLRAAFEAPAFAAAAPCYSDSAAAEDLSEALSDHGLRLEDAAAEDALRAQRASLDYGAYRQLLAKLAIYKLGGDVAVTAADISACAPLPDDPESHDVADAALAGQVQKAAQELARLQSNSSAGAAILIALSWQMKRLYGVVSAIESGTPRDTAFKSLRPPVFGDARTRLSRQLDRWSCQSLESAMRLVHDAQLASRAAGNAQPDAAIARVLLRVAMMASKP